MHDGVEVLCVGETMVMVTPSGGEALTAQSTYLLRAGGAESNVATSLAALGHRSAWAGAVGADPLGDVVLDQVAIHGVDVSLVRRVASHRTGVYFKNPSPAGTTVFYYRDNSAASQMSRDGLREWTEALPRIVHVSGITAALSESCKELIHAIVVERAFGSALVSFDVNFRPSLWPAGFAAEELLKLARASDVVFVGRDEGELVWGTPTADSIRSLLEEPRHIIVKDGSLNAYEYTDGMETRCAAPKVDVLEPVGAGDAFAAGWLSGLLRGHSARERLRFGHLMASRVLTSVSDFASPPSGAEIDAALLSDPADWRYSVRLDRG